MDNKEAPLYSVCVVFDSQVSVRKKLVQDVSDSGLYQRVEEPSQLSADIFDEIDGAIDTCLIGSGLSVEGASTFIDLSRKTEKGKMCSYIAVFSDPDDPEVAPLRERVNGELSSDYNLDSLIVTLHDSIADNEHQRGSKKKSNIKPETEDSSGANSGGLTGGLSGLKKISKGYTNGNFMLTGMGEPSKITRNALELVVLEICGGDANKNEQLSPILMPILVDWFIEMAQQSEAIATKNLRPRLAALIGKV